MRSIRHRRSIFATGVFAAALVAVLTVPAIAQERGDDSGRASKNGLTEGKIGAADVKITYGRPKVKGREIWGALVPYSKVWRAGADEATTITFSKDVKIEGKAVPAGTYGLFFLPEKDKWTVIINKVPKQWGAFRYAEAEDLIRADVKPTMSEAAVEELTYEIAGDKIILKWEKVAVPVTVTG
jgi:DUF2911 family protein